MLAIVTTAQMNYYKHHIKDWMVDTIDLSLVEEAVYRRLVEYYYLCEGPIDRDSAIRKCRIPVDAIASLDVILRDYFTKNAEGLFEQKRCSAEIKEYKDKQKKATQSAKVRWSDGSANAMRTHSERTAPINHKPLTINHTIPSVSPPPSSGAEVLDLETEKKKVVMTMGASGITHKFQDDAFRYAKQLNVDLQGNPDLKGRWIKFVKDANLGTIQNLITYLVDYRPYGAIQDSESRMKYFLQLYYNKLKGAAVSALCVLIMAHSAQAVTVRRTTIVSTQGSAPKSARVVVTPQPVVTPPASVKLVKPPAGSKSAIARMIRQAFGADGNLMVAICLAESGMRPEVSVVDSNGVQSTGLFQINDGVWKTEEQINELRDPAHNVQRALGKYRSQGLRAWGAYTNKSYLKHLSIAQTL